MPDTPPTPQTWSGDIAIPPEVTGDFNITSGTKLVDAFKSAKAQNAAGKVDEWYPSGDAVLGGVEAQKAAKTKFLESDAGKSYLKQASESGLPQKFLNRSLDGAYGQWVTDAKTKAEDAAELEKFATERFGGQEQFKAAVAKLPEPMREFANDPDFWNFAVAVSETIKSSTPTSDGGAAQTTTDNGTAPDDAPVIDISVKQPDGTSKPVKRAINYTSREDVLKAIDEFQGVPEARPALERARRMYEKHSAKPAVKK